MEIPERLNQIYGKHSLAASKLIKEKVLSGNDAERVQLNARIDAIEEALALVFAHIPELAAFPK